MIDKILYESNQFKLRISELKKSSEFYPSVLIKDFPIDFHSNDKIIFASTLVRIERDGKWYMVHCVESIIPNKNISEKNLLLTLMNSVHKIQHLYKLNGEYEEIDHVQISETERIRRICEM